MPARGGDEIVVTNGILRHRRAGCGWNVDQPGGCGQRLSLRSVQRSAVHDIHATRYPAPRMVTVRSDACTGQRRRSIWFHFGPNGPLARFTRTLQTANRAGAGVWCEYRDSVVVSTVWLRETPPLTTAADLFRHTEQLHAEPQLGRWRVFTVR